MHILRLKEMLHFFGHFSKLTRAIPSSLVHWNTHPYFAELTSWYFIGNRDIVIPRRVIDGTVQKLTFLLHFFLFSPRAESDFEGDLPSAEVENVLQRVVKTLAHVSGFGNNIFLVLFFRGFKNEFLVP